MEPGLLAWPAGIEARTGSLLFAGSRPLASVYSGHQFGVWGWPVWVGLLAANQVDYPIFWRRLSHQVAGGPPEPVPNLFIDRPAFDAWLLHYSNRLEGELQADAASLMLKTNPKDVLRNHPGQLAIRAAKLKDYSGVEDLLALVQSPFDEHPGPDDQSGFPPEWAAQIEI